MKVCALAPVFNEAEHIAEVVRGCRRHVPVVVIDDGSADGSAELAADAGAEVLRQPENMGKGLALRRGFQYALDAGYDAVVTLDGDGQHDPADLPHFIAAAERDPSLGLVIGCRMFDVRGMPLARVFANRAMSAVVSRLCHQTVLDTQSGYRLIRACVLRRLRLTATRYDIESELLIQACQRGFRVQEIAIATRYADARSDIHVARETARFVKLVWRHAGRGG